MSGPCQAIKDIVKLLEESKAGHKRLTEELQSIDQEITQVMGEQKRLEAKLTHLRSMVDGRRTEERNRIVSVLLPFPRRQQRPMSKGEALKGKGDGKACATAMDD